MHEVKDGAAPSLEARPNRYTSTVATLDRTLG